MAQVFKAPKKLRLFLIEIGELSYFAGRFFKEVLRPPFEIKEFLRQCYQIGNRSLVLVLVTGFIIGLVMDLQSRPTMIQFGAASMMPRAFSSGSRTAMADATMQNLISPEFRKRSRQWLAPAGGRR